MSDHRLLVPLLLGLAALAALPGDRGSLRPAEAPAVTQLVGSYEWMHDVGYGPLDEPVLSLGELSPGFASPPVSAPQGQPDDIDARIEAVRKLLTGSPLEEWAPLMVWQAELRQIDWRLMPVIAVLESSAGRHACGGNAWGFASCAVTFDTFEEGIKRVALALSEPPYAGLDADEALCMWVSGGPCVGEHATTYRDKGRWLMAQIEGVE